jgi:hypothetical protein
MLYIYNKGFIKRFRFNYLYTLFSFIYFIKKKLKINIILIPFSLFNI